MSPHLFLTIRSLFRSKQDDRCLLTDCRGFTLVEVIVSCVIIGLLAAMALPAYDKIKEKVQSVRAMEEIRGIEKAINAYTIDNGGNFPTALSEIKMDQIKDPWGNGYVYHRAGEPFPGGEFTSARAIIEGTPLNNDFDLFSMGRDGHTNPDIGNDLSKDDVIRIGDEIGLASELSEL